MRIPRTIRFLAGSAAVYLAVAMTHACSASDPLLASSTGAPGHGGAGGNRAASGGGADGKGGAGSVMNPVPDAQANESGARLRAKYYAGADGSRQWLGWYDSERGEDCFFKAFPDGLMYCVPSEYQGSTAPQFVSATIVVE